MSLSRPRATRGSVTHPFIEGFTLPQEHDISLDEIRIECLHDAQNNIPTDCAEGGKESLSIRRWKGVGPGTFDVQNYTSPHDWLGFFKINLPTIQPRSESDKDRRPAQREPHVRMDVIWPK